MNRLDDRLSLAQRFLEPRLRDPRLRVKLLDQLIESLDVASGALGTTAGVARLAGLEFIRLDILGVWHILRCFDRCLQRMGKFFPSPLDFSMKLLHNRSVRGKRPETFKLETDR